MIGNNYARKLPIQSWIEFNNIDADDRLVIMLSTHAQWGSKRRDAAIDIAVIIISHYAEGY